MNLISRIFSLMLASIVFICLFIYQYFTVDLNLELFFRDVTVFALTYITVKFLFGYVESILEVGRKAL